MMFKLSKDDLDKLIRNTVEDKLRMEQLLVENQVHGTFDLSYYVSEIARDEKILKALSKEVL